MNKKYYVIIILIFLNSCVLQKHNEENYSKQIKQKKEIITEFNSSRQTHEWIALRGKINVFEKDSPPINFDFTIKSKKDSIVWVSARAFLGLELFRAQITQDTFFFINRMNNTYFKKPIAQLKDLAKNDFSFYDIQKTITNNIELSEEKYELKFNDNTYVFFNKNRSYFINTEYNIEKINITHEENILEFVFQNHRIKDKFPRKILVNISGEKNIEAIINYQSIERNKKQAINFKIPDLYEEVL